MRPFLLAGVLVLAACGGAPAASVATQTAPPATPSPSPVPSASTAATAAPPSPSPTPVRAVTLVADLRPKVTNEERTATGTVKIVLDLERSTAQFEFSLQGLPDDARVQFAHIHLGTAEVEGPILLDSGLTAARFRPSGGTGSVSLPAVDCDPKLAADILANPGGYHFMVHSARNPDGFVRGQLRRG